MVEDRTKRSFADTFHIDATTGAISVAGTVDFEAHPVYQLMVTASDGGSAAALSADAMVVVRVADSNDNSPTIRISTLRASDTDVAATVQYRYSHRRRPDLQNILRCIIRLSYVYRIGSTSDCDLQRAKLFWEYGKIIYEQYFRRPHDFLSESHLRKAWRSP